MHEIRWQNESKLLNTQILSTNKKMIQLNE